MDIVVTTYVVYLAITVSLTVWVARTLSLNGLRFLSDVFEGDVEMAASVNHLLVVGFYLINLGWMCLMMRVVGEVAGARGAMETLAVKLGGVLLILGTMHFFNLYVFSRIRRSHRRQAAP